MKEKENGKPIVRPLAIIVFEKVGGGGNYKILRSHI